MEGRWWTLVAVCLGVFMLLLDVTIVNVALPDIQQAFTARLSDLQWVIDAYSLVLAALLLIAGSIADLVGRRRVFAVGIVMFSLASLLCGFADGWLFLSIARAVQGIGGAIMFATSLALLARAFRPDQRGVAFGVFGAVTGVAVAIGPVLGGALTSWLSWRWIFFVNFPLGLLALLITLVWVQESKDPGARRPDVPGLLVFSTALACLVFGLVRSQPDGWGAADVYGTLTASAVLLAAFIAIESRSPIAMFDLHLLRVPTFSGGLIAAWAISASIFSVLTYLVIYIQSILGYSALESGLRILPLSGAVFLAAGIAGRLVDIVPIRYLIAAGFILIGVGLVLMRGVEAGQSWTHFILGFVFAGVGAGFINVPLASTAVGVVSARHAGMASGANSTFRQVGIATGVATLGSIFSSQIANKTADLLANTPLASRTDEIAAASTGGQSSRVLDHLSTSERGLAAHVIRVSVAAGLNDILLISSIVAFAAAVLTFVLIRQKDFVATEEGDLADERPADPALAVG
jgi:EmrB/QacA subfamily drug resistance transporter